MNKTNLVCFCCCKLFFLSGLKNDFSFKFIYIKYLGDKSIIIKNIKGCFKHKIFLKIFTNSYILNRFLNFGQTYFFFCFRVYRFILNGDHC